MLILLLYHATHLELQIILAPPTHMQWILAHPDLNSECGYQHLCGEG